MALVLLISFNLSNQFQLIKLPQLYPHNFSDCEIMTLEHQLANYIVDVQSHQAFQDLKGLGDLCGIMVEEKKDITCLLVLRLVAPTFILPVSATTVERAFLGINIVKTRLCNRMGDPF